MTGRYWPKAAVHQSLIISNLDTSTWYFSNPDFKTNADFQKDNGLAIKRVCSKFVLLCKHMGMFTQSVIAVDGSKFKAVNSRDNNYTDRKLKARIVQTEDRVTRYLDELDRADGDTDLFNE